MPGITDTLKNLRGSNYGGKPAKAPSDRVVKLNPEELTAVVSNDVAPGAQVTLEINGTLDADGTFHVATVQMGSIDDSKQPPDDSLLRVRQDTIPSPS